MSAKSELLSNIYQRSDQSLTFRVCWLLSKFVGSEKAIDSVSDSDVNASEFCQEFIRNSQIDVQSNLPEWADPDYHGGVLIYGPHMTHIEPYIILSLVEGKKVSFVAINSAKTLLPSQFHEHVIGVTPSHLLKPAKSSAVHHRIAHSVRKKLFAKGETRTEDQIKVANQEALKDAASRVANGEVVIIFPCANQDILTTKWKPGVGVVISELLEMEGGNPNVLIQDFRMNKIGFVKDFGLQLRRVFVKQKTSKRLSISIDWGSAQKLGEFSQSLTNATPKEITEKLEEGFKQQDLPDIAKS